MNGIDELAEIVGLRTGSPDAPTLEKLRLHVADTISALEWPAITILVRRSAIGNIDRAAWRFRHSAPLIFGFQNSGESNASIQLLSTIQTKPFFPRTAIS